MKSSNIADLLKDNQGRQYFFKNSKSVDYLIDEELQDQEITKNTNIYVSLVSDCEYTQPLCVNPKKLTLELLQSNPNRQLVQVDIFNQVLKQEVPELKSISHLSKARNLKVSSSLVNRLEKIKSARTLNLTSQFKHVLYEDAEILLNPFIKEFYESQITEEQYKYPCYDPSGCQFIDFLKMKGFENISIEHNEYNETNKKVKDMPKLTVKLFGYYMIADICKLFGGEYLKDIRTAMLQGKISLKRRLAASGFHKGWYTNWVTTLNNIKYQTIIEFVDLGGLHGIESFETVLTNLGMDTTEKNLLNDVKDNMLLAMIERPTEFKKYALGDLNLYEVLKKHNKLLYEIYKSSNVEKYFILSKLTTGAYTNELQEAVLFELLNYNVEELEQLLNEYNEKHKRPKRKLSIKYVLKLLTYTASPQYMKGYINVHMQDDADYKKHIGSKTMGGRCYLNRLLTTSIMSSDNAICDIDIAGAYSTVYNSLNYFFGHPVIMGFAQHKVTLKKFYQEYKNELVKRSFKLMVETKDPLIIEQDIFCSWTNLTFKKQAIKTSSVDDVFSHLLNDNRYDEYQNMQSVDLDATNNDIFTTELHNTTLTWDDLDYIFNELKKEQREEMLDKFYMQTAVFYPASTECKTIEELKEKVQKFKVNGKQPTIKEISHAKIDNKGIDKSNYWVGVNFGEIIGEHIKVARAKNKKTNPSLATLFKLVGNTLYGINVSQYFITSNVVLAANITSMCRIGMWYVEKAVNIHQTITDGGIFDLNKVPHLIYKTMDTKCLVRAYQFTDKELANYKKWNTRPITCNGNRITFTQDKGWLLDDTYYKTDEVDKLYADINQITMQHVQKIFPHNSLLNDTYKHVKISSNGEIEHIEKKGLFEFEVKALTCEASFHGAANYYYHDINKNEDKLKMRGYETKKSTVAYSLNENNELVSNEHYYKTTHAVEMFLKNIKDNPQAVTILPPFIKPIMLKVNQHKQQYKKTFQYSKLFPGDEYYELVTLPIFTMRFKFKTLKQKQNWVRYYTSLKNRFGGLSFEIFFMNEDGTCNYQKMLKYIDKLISKGEANPKNVFDPHNHLIRDYKNKHILKRIELMRQIKNMLRILNVGITQYCKESFDIIDEIAVAA
jgi:hypothetical protein